MASQADIVAAIGLLAEKAGGSLAKKPNVADVEQELGEDISADERDTAWKAYQDAQEGTKPTATPDAPADPVEVATTRVSNAYSTDLSVFGVVIPKDGSSDVPNFNAEHAVIRMWLDAGIISVG